MSKLQINEQKLASLYQNGIQIKDIATYFNCDRNVITRRLQKLGLKQGKSYQPPKSKEDPLKDKKEQMKKLYLDGLSCKEIGDKLNLSERTINYHLHRMNVEIRPTSKITYEEFKTLWEQNKTDKEIANYFGIAENTVKGYRVRLNKKLNKDFKRNKHFSDEDIKLTYDQEQFIYCSLLGDLNISKPDKLHPNCRLAIVHSQKQKELFMKKVEILGKFMGAYKLTNLIPDKRTGKIYPTYRGNSKAHPIFTKIYNELYINGIKIVTKEFLDKINSPIALAFWFMDDGTYNGNIATNGFTEEEVDLLIKWMNEKWNIHCTKQQNKQHIFQYVLHIKQESRKHFEELIFPYIIPNMYYKLKFLENLAESVG